MIFKTNSAFILLGLLGIGTNCLAGLPEVDPAVKYLQDQFKNGITPSLEALQLGAQWACTTYYATNIKTDQKEGPFLKYQFSERDELIYAGDLTLPNGDQASAVRNFKFDKNTGTWSGLTASGKILNYLRSTEKDLILESVELKSPEPNVSSPSISDPQYLVYAYSFCHIAIIQEIAELQSPTEIQIPTEIQGPTEAVKQAKKITKKKRTSKKDDDFEFYSEYIPLIEPTEFDDLPSNQDRPVKKGFFKFFNSLLSR